MGRSQDDTVDNAGLTKLQCTSFTIPEASMPVEYSATKSGQFVTTSKQGHHAQGTKLWTFDTVLKGTPTSVLLALEAVFEDASSSPRVLQNTYSFPTASYKHDSTSSPNTFNIRFIDDGADATDGGYEPLGYAMTGAFEITGSITAIRNDDIHDLIDGGEFHNSETVDVNIQESSGFIVALDKCILGESTIDNGGAVLTNTIPFTVVGDDDISSASDVVSITIA